MDDTTILNKINELNHLYKYEKDGGRVLVAALAKEFNSYDSNTRNLVIDFFIRELQTDQNGMRGLTLPVLEDMEANEAAYRIFETYRQILKNDDPKWEKEIVTALMILRFPDPEEFYSDYIEKYTNRKPDNGYLFFLGVLYCRVDPSKALNLLSDYFIKHLAAPDEKMVAFFKNRMGYLVFTFIKNPKDYTIELLQQTAKKNKEVGIRLKEIMLYFFHSDLALDLNNKFIRREIQILEELKF